MAAYLMFGTYSPEAMRAISSKRSDGAQEVIGKYGGEFKAAYALLGEVDLLVMADLPDMEHAMRLRRL
jgi:uncharacterized protein with GYD domain